MASCGTVIAITTAEGTPQVMVPPCLEHAGYPHRLGRSAPLLAFLLFAAVWRAVGLVAKAVSLREDVDLRCVGPGSTSGVFNAATDLGGLAAPALRGPVSQVAGLDNLFGCCPPWPSPPACWPRLSSGERCAWSSQQGRAPGHRAPDGSAARPSAIPDAAAQAMRC